MDGESESEQQALFAQSRSQTSSLAENGDTADETAEQSFPAWYSPQRLLALFCTVTFLVYLDRGVIACNGVNGNASSGIQVLKVLKSAAAAVLLWASEWQSVSFMSRGTFT